MAGFVPPSPSDAPDASLPARPTFSVTSPTAASSAGKLLVLGPDPAILEEEGEDDLGGDVVAGGVAGGGADGDVFVVNGSARGEEQRAAVLV